MGSKDAGSARDLFVVGPDGFHRRIGGTAALFSATVVPGRLGRSMLRVMHLGTAPLTLTITDNAYGAAAMTVMLRPGEARDLLVDLDASHGWYDRTLSALGQTLRIAGNARPGQPSFSDPALGAAGPLSYAAV